MAEPTDILKQRVRVLSPELGTTGLPTWGGVVADEFLRQLQGTQGIKIYREMRDNDAMIGALLNLIDLLIRQVTWRYDPADSSQTAGRACELAQSSLNQMAFTWRDTVSEILSFLVYGWSYFEICYQKRADGLIGWKKLAIRGQDTLSSWRFDDEGGIQAMVQVAPPTYKLVTLPIEKSLLFRTSLERNNPMGRSILRPAFRTWFFKRRIEEIEGIGIERDLTGIPVLTPPDGLDLWNANDADAVSKRAEAEKVVRNLRRDQHEGIVKPFGWELQLLTTGGRRQFDITQTLNRMDARIAMTSLAEFLLFGTQNVGSFALSSSKTHLFSVATGSYLDIIADIMTRHAVTRLMEANAIPIELSPKLVHGDIETVDMAELADVLFKLAGAGMPVFPDGGLQKHLFELMGLPQPEGD
ncbi:MAG: hypothetical protein PHE55_05100 [Methylococcaceae bacterium]|nr:hypothetical protein [Methylococcaceae bacterium]